jgi:regulatory protein
MSLILSIEKRRGVAFVVLEDAPALRVPAPLFRERPLQAGGEVDVAEHLRWMRARARGFALNAAVAFLAARPRSVREVERRLDQAGYDAETIGGVVSRLTREGYLNDAEFADQWAQSRGGRALGGRRIAQELRSKGVGREAIEAALSCMDEEEGLRVAAAHAEKLLARAQGKDPRDARHKALRALARRGYDWETANAALDRAGWGRSGED